MPETNDAPAGDRPEDETSTRADTESDPALDDGESADWSSEGGAATEGPATDTSDR